MLSQQYQSVLVSIEKIQPRKRTIIIKLCQLLTNMTIIPTLYPACLSPTTDTSGQDKCNVQLTLS